MAGHFRLLGLRGWSALLESGTWGSPQEAKSHQGGHERCGAGALAKNPAKGPHGLSLKRKWISRNWVGVAERQVSGQKDGKSMRHFPSASWRVLICPLHSVMLHNQPAAATSVQTRGLTRQPFIDLRSDEWLIRIF